MPPAHINYEDLVRAIKSGHPDVDSKKIERSVKSAIYNATASENFLEGNPRISGILKSYFYNNPIKPSDLDDLNIPEKDPNIHIPAPFFPKLAPASMNPNLAPAPMNPNLDDASGINPNISNNNPNDLDANVDPVNPDSLDDNPIDLATGPDNPDNINAPNNPGNLNPNPVLGQGFGQGFNIDLNSLGPAVNRPPNEPALQTKKKLSIKDSWKAVQNDPKTIAKIFPALLRKYPAMDEKKEWKSYRETLVAAAKNREEFLQEQQEGEINPSVDVWDEIDLLANATEEITQLEVNPITGSEVVMRAEGINNADRVVGAKELVKSSALKSLGDKTSAANLGTSGASIDGINTPATGQVGSRDNIGKSGGHGV
jgi:hypothetical protein